jgi:uncharacterized protein YyaL (SSP411 family)
MDFSRNNLDRSSSLYLRQHHKQLIWWQEWSKETLVYAREQKRPIFVSVGYSACHWCHVMAGEVFDAVEVADFLNRHFVAIKVDRDERPDIDHYLMSFIAAIGGQGGWPLNCFLTPDGSPVYALTYAPLHPKNGMPGFLQVLSQVDAYIRRTGGPFERFLPVIDEVDEVKEEGFSEVIFSAFDMDHGGFGTGPKFPPYSTLLFMMYYFDRSRDSDIRRVLEKTLDVMAERGLHDHLQGGFFRYCVDRQWLLPHFEKMLYDQAMMLWIYSLAYAVLKKDAYRLTARKIIDCLSETFEEDGLYCASHDADAGHKEGAVYLWDKEELKRLLNDEEYALFTGVYVISDPGRFEGADHLIKRQSVFLPAIEKKLLSERKKREQPVVDRKVITSWNALAGIGFIHAYRYIGDHACLEKAQRIVRQIFKRHADGSRLARCSCDGNVQSGDFLEDHASFLLLLTYLQEDAGNFEEEVDAFSRSVMSFRQEGRWVESFVEDFVPISADPRDLSLPSAVSLAELGLVRASILLKKSYSRFPYRMPLHFDFYNIVGLLANGLFHILESPSRLPWDVWPVNTVQRRGPCQEDCFNGTCRSLKV